MSVFGTSSENGLRSSATREAFELTGDNYYNPSWGMFGGKQRSAKVAERFRPVAVLAYAGTVSPATTLDVSAAYRFGKDSYSALAWYGARTPYPDYYREMPSFIENPVIAEAARELWRDGDQKVTQVDWEDMYAQNLLNGAGAVYILERRVEDLREAQAAVSALTRVDNRTTVSYGIRGRSENTLHYKEMKDLLGGMPIRDFDRFLIDDELYGDLSVNDVRNPDRIVGGGDRFGYNYNIYGSRLEMFGTLHYTTGRFRISGGTEFAATSLQRQGNYEKELYPGGLSYGKSEKLSFETYTAKLSAGYSFSPRHIIGMSAIAATLAPDYGTVFVSPSYTNKTIDDPVTVSLFGVDADYMMTYENFRLKLSGFYTGSSDESALYGYYDDIAAVYSDMVLSGIDKVYYGGEIGFSYDFSPRISFSAAASAGRYTYASDPVSVIMDDATLKPYVEGAKSYLDGYRLGNTPETAVSTELEYNNYGWLASLTLNYMGNRYISPNPLRRMERAYNLAGSPERFSRFVGQEKLGDAFTVDIFALRSFDIGDRRFTVVVSVNNLLDNTDIIYSGYEQMRIMRRGTGVNTTWRPFDSKYLYSYGRTFYCSLTYRF